MAGMKQGTIPKDLRGGRRARPASNDAHPAGEPEPTSPATASATTSGSGSGKRSDGGKGSGGGAAKRPPQSRQPAPAAVPAGEFPFAGAKRKAMNHQIFDNLTARVAEASNAIVKAGLFSPREASQASIVNAALAFGTPEDVDSGAQLLRELTVARMSEPDFAGAKRKAMNHQVFDVLQVRVATLANAIAKAGLFTEREASQATIVNAVLYRHAPTDAAEGAALLRDFAVLRAGGTPDRN